MAMKFAWGIWRYLVTFRLSVICSTKGILCRDYPKSGSSYSASEFEHLSWQSHLSSCSHQSMPGSYDSASPVRSGLRQACTIFLAPSTLVLMNTIGLYSAAGTCFRAAACTTVSMVPARAPGCRGRAHLPETALIGESGRVGRDAAAPTA